MAKVENIKPIAAGSARLVIETRLAQLPKRLINNLGDLLDPENKIRRKQKLQNIDLILRYPDSDIITAFNLVVMLRNERWAKASRILTEAGKIGVAVYQFFKNNK
jgi:hypothetical protein